MRIACLRGGLLEVAEGVSLAGVLAEVATLVVEVREAVGKITGLIPVKTYG